MIRIRLGLLPLSAVAIAVLAGILVGVQTGWAACTVGAADAGKCKGAYVCCQDVGCSELCFNVMGTNNWYKLYDFQGYYTCVETDDETKKCKMEPTPPFSDWCAKALRYTSLANCQNNISPTQGFWTTPAACTGSSGCF